MKRLLLPLLSLLFLASCEKETSPYLQTDQMIEENGFATLRSPAPKIDVCHYDAENDSWHVINISQNAWPEHAGHGDVQLIDEDDDGYVTSENECGLPVDCDDTDAKLTDNCSTSCVEGEVEIDFNGPLFVAPEDEPGLYTSSGAKDACAAKDAEDGCGWYLPTKDELNALYEAKDDIGGFSTVYYWSSTTDAGTASGQNFNSPGGDQVFIRVEMQLNCRCVRR